MKRFILVILFCGVCGCLFAQNGVIKDFTGTVELKHAGSANYIPATVGAQVMTDTVIYAGHKSKAIIEVGSALIAVQPLTRLTLTEISTLEKTENLNMSLQAGRIRVDVKPPAGTKTIMKVSNPSAVASVRGTSFYFDVMNLKVNEGTVAFKGNAGYTVMVSAGSFSLVDAYGTAIAPQSNNDAELAPQYPYGYDPRTTGTTGGRSGDDDGDSDFDVGVDY